MKKGFGTFFWIAVAIGVVAAAVLVVNQTSLGNVIAYPTKCTDDDVNSKFPNGINYDTKGAIKLNKARFDDYCEDTINLVEYYCSGQEIESTSYNCPNGCLRGRCK